MSKEDIAQVIADIRAGKALTDMRDPEALFAKTKALMAVGPVVDVTAVYEQWMNGPERYMYEDHSSMQPPWIAATMAYENQVGNVMVMQYTSHELDDDEGDAFTRWQPANERIDFGEGTYARQDERSTSDPNHQIDWENVRWGVTVLLYSGGHASNGTRVPTAGPLHMWRIPVYEDGSMADIQWTQLEPRLEPKVFDNAMMTLLDTITMVNCVNVVIAEPERKVARHERRRIERLGVRFSEIHIRPMAKSYRGKGTPLADMPRAMHGVRGHTALYGPEYGRGLLFGKYSGKIWIPPHVRGSKDAGEVLQEYIPEP